MSNDQPKNNPPQEIIRDGNIKANIWRNDGENGPYHTTSFARTFKNQDGEYRDSQSFSQNDLLPLSELARNAYTRVNELRREHSQSKTPELQQTLELQKSQHDTRRDDFKEKRVEGERPNARQPSKNRNSR
jgi:hypothetical protein